MNAAERELIQSDIEGYLRRYQEKELLRFVAVGSVDDGKSTLIGRLLFDTGSVYDDQLAAAREATHMEGTDLDLSLITDGLAAEREQGITIDVAYRYFSTSKRKFIIADTPGHVQYTRNMVTGASTANVVVILIDARLGVLQQSRRHAYIASLLGIPRLAVCVNKMDLVGFDRAVFERIREEFSAFTRALSPGFVGVTFFPVSALRGDNCVRRSKATEWYDGPTVLEFLETVLVSENESSAGFRFPVQYVLRPNLDYRAFAGRVASGLVNRGDTVVVLPSGRQTRVSSVDTYDGELAVACAQQSVAIRLEDEVDVSRGDMLVHPNDKPSVARAIDAHLVWMSDAPLDPRKTYLLKHTTQTVRAEVDRIHWRKDMDTLEEVSAATLEMNDIGRVTLTSHRPLFVDPYAKSRETGSFILIDTLTNATVGAGMILGESQAAGAHAGPLDVAHQGAVLVVITSAPPPGLVQAIEDGLAAVGAKGVAVSSGHASTSVRAAHAVADAGFIAVLVLAPGAVEEAELEVRSHGRRARVVHLAEDASVEAASLAAIQALSVG